MSRRGIAFAILCLSMPLSCLAQASDAARSEIIRKLLAEEAAARIDLPFGGEGVRLSDSGEIDGQKLQKQIQKNGKSVVSGRIVRLTKIEFDSKSVAIELDGGGKEKKGLGGHVQVSAGGVSSPSPQTSTVSKARGSKITISFASKVPSGLTSDQLKLILGPILDFTKQTLASSSIETLPPEFQEAVKAKEARIGMDEETVLLAMGRPNRRTSEKVDGVMQEKWQYDIVGNRRTFVTFEKSIVVKITEYQ